MFEKRKKAFYLSGIVFFLISIPISAYFVTTEYSFDQRSEAAVFRSLVAEIQEEIDSVEHVSGVVRLEFPEDMPNEKIERIIGRPRNVPELFQDTPFERVEYVEVNEESMAYEMAYFSRYTSAVSVGLNHIVELSNWTADGNSRALPRDWNSKNHWYFNRVKLPEVWKMQGCLEGSDMCGGSKDVVVAVIDSGLAFSSYTSNYRWCHPETGKCQNYNTRFGVAPEVAGINLWKNPDGKNAKNGFCNDYHGIDMTVAVYNRSTFNGKNPCNSSQYYKEGQPDDDYFHGTYVTGVISSSMNNLSSSPVGIAHNVSILPIKATIPFTDSMEERVLESAIYYAAQYADVINMSFSVGGPVAQTAIKYAVDRGIVLVASTGNNGEYSNHHVGFPAADPNVIAVGAINPNNRRSPYSAYGSQVDFVVPVGDGNVAGNAVWHQYISCSGTSSCTRYFNYFNWGTSLAAPQVAGAVGLIKSLDSSLSPSQIKQVLIDTAEDLSPSGKDIHTGYGLINLQKIYEQLQSTLPSASCGKLNGVKFTVEQGNWPSDDFCSMGNPSPSKPLFPSLGGSSEWDCVGNDGERISCKASREFKPDSEKPSCGSLDKMEFEYTQEDWPSKDFCKYGVVDPSNPSFPGEGETIHWECKIEELSISCWAKRGESERTPEEECKQDEDCRRASPYEICFKNECLRGDVDNDGVIDGADFGVFKRDYREFKEEGWDIALKRSDFNMDERISMGDYSIFVKGYRIFNSID